MERVTVEPAGTDDVAAVTDLWVDLATSQREHGSHIRPAANRTVVRESIARHAVGDGLIVARDSSVVGFVMLTVETGAFEQDCARGVVENLYVAPGCRNEGIGTALLEAAEATLWDRGVDTVSLEVMAGNQSAREFYRQRGYDSHRVELEKSADADERSP